MTAADTIDIFDFTNYRSFLSAYIDRNYLAKGKSYRHLSKHCGINSPNYFQQIINKQKNMTAQMAEKVGNALGFKGHTLKYFIQLVRLDWSRDADKSFATYNELSAIAAKHRKRTVEDEQFHSNWHHQIIWNLAHTKGFDANPASIRRALRGSASLDEIRKSLSFLLKKGYLSYDRKKSLYKAEDIKIETGNGSRNLDLQRNHNRFLQTAQMRLNDDISQREFQGLTMALTEKQLPILKQEMREFIRRLGETLDEPGDGEVVIRLQMAAFVVADPNLATKISKKVQDV